MSFKFPFTVLFQEPILSREVWVKRPQKEHWDLQMHILFLSIMDKNVFSGRQNDTVKGGFGSSSAG
jgi:hypothetical protein